MSCLRKGVPPVRRLVGVQAEDQQREDEILLLLRLHEQVRSHPSEGTDDCFGAKGSADQDDPGGEGTGRDRENAGSRAEQGPVLDGESCKRGG